jgi:predicted Zn-dependent peptidase
MQIKKLANGLTVIYQKRYTDTITIQVSVKVGSKYESKQNSGISHFLEHIVFDATKNYPDSKLLSNMIESKGGELNAYTSDERTTFHIKILKKHFTLALDILSEILLLPLFKDEDIEKERKIIVDEIKLVTDEPRNHQWVLFEKTLFKKHPARNPTYGNVNVVKKLTKKQILDYYHSYYVANNTTIMVVGNVDNPFSLVEKYFKNFKPGKLPKYILPNEPRQTSIQKKVELRKLGNSYIIFGYKTVPRLNKDSYVLDVIRAYLARGQSGKLFHEIRTKLGLCYEIGMHHEPATDYGFLAVYFGTDKKNIARVVKLIIELMKDTQNISQKEITEAKEYIEGNFYVENEDTYELADSIGSWALVNKPELINSYISNINKVTLQEIKQAVKKYFTDNYTLAIIKQK